MLQACVQPEGRGRARGTLVGLVFLENHHLTLFQRNSQEVSEIKKTKPLLGCKIHPLLETLKVKGDMWMTYLQDALLATNPQRDQNRGL